MDWDPVTVVSKQCGVELGICHSIRRLLNEGCTVPFMCRYRTAQIGNSSPNTVQEIQQTFSELECVANKTAQIIRQDTTARNELCQVEKGLLHKTSMEVQHLRSSLIPPAVQLSLKRCTSLTDITALTAPYKKRPRQTKADIARELGLGPIAESMIAGSGSRFCFWNDLTTAAPNAAIEMSPSQTGEALIHLIAEIIAKGPETFEFLKVLCNQIPPIIRSSRKTSKASPSQTSTSESERTKKKREVQASFSETSHTFDDYFIFSKNVREIESHQTLAINRGERFEQFRGLKQSEPPSSRPDAFIGDLMNSAVKTAWRKFIKAQLSRRIRSEITKTAERCAVKIFARNLRSLLLTPPLNLHENQGRVMGIDPGFKNGCKTAIISPNGNRVLHTCILHLHCGSIDSRNSQLKQLNSLIQKFDVRTIAVGDGVAARETEMVLSHILNEENASDVNFRKRRKNNEGRMCDVEESPRRCEISSSSIRRRFMSVSEAGVSIWSVSPAAENDLPDLKPVLRGSVAIARRLMDPLGEYTKVEPKHLGLGMYQLDMPTAELELALSSVVEECVSLVGLDLNSAPFHLLKNIAGLGPARAAAIIAYRKTSGSFISRRQLREVKGIGPKIFQQCAGFLRVRSWSRQNNSNDVDMLLSVQPNVSSSKILDKNLYRKIRHKPEYQIEQMNISRSSSNGISSSVRLRSDLSQEILSTITPLDDTWIHPEQYPITERLISASNTTLDLFGTEDFKEKIKKFCSGSPTLWKELLIDEPTQKLIVDGLTTSTGFIDIRDRISAPLLRSQVLKLDDIQTDSVLRGRIANITSFGAFIDIGIGIDGLLHRNHLAGVLGSLMVGQILDVKVVSINLKRDRPRISLKLNNQ